MAILGFLFLAIMNKAARNIHLQVLGDIFSKMVVPFYLFPSNIRVPVASCSYHQFMFVSIYNFSFSGRSIVLFHYGFNYNDFLIVTVEYFFMCLLDILL